MTEKRETAKQAAAGKQPEVQQKKSDPAMKATAAMSKHLAEAQQKTLGLPPGSGPTN